MNNGALFHTYRTCQLTLEINSELLKHAPSGMKFKGKSHSIFQMQYKHHLKCTPCNDKLPQWSQPGTELGEKSRVNRATLRGFLFNYWLCSCDKSSVLYPHSIHQFPIRSPDSRKGELVPKGQPCH